MTTISWYTWHHLWIYTMVLLVIQEREGWILLIRRIYGVIKPEIPACNGFVLCLLSLLSSVFGLCLKVEPNQELKGLICNGANVLPTRVVNDAFRDEFGMLSPSSFSYKCSSLLVKIRFE